MGFAKDLSGQRFTRLVAQKRIGTSPDRQALWMCICDCGKEISVASGHLKSAHTKSCGCFNTDSTLQRFTTHGESYGSTFAAWRNMKQRCTNPKNPAYPNYGGRGITVCDRWMVFENFLADMGKRPDGTSIDRVDNDAGYSKENCRWTDRATQSRNKRSTVLIEINGVFKCAKDWAKEFNVDQQSLSKRIRAGIDGSTAIAMAMQRKRNTALME